MKMLLRILRRQIERRPGAYAFLFVMTALTAAMWIIEPLYARHAINLMLEAKEGEPVDYRFIFGVWIGLFALISGVQAAGKFWAWKLTERFIFDYREKVYGHVLRLGIAFHTRQKSGETVKILDNAADTLADLQREFVIQLTPSIISAAVFLGIGWAISPMLTAVLLFSIVCYMCIAFFGTIKTAALQQRVNNLWVESIGRAFDAVTNIFSVKSGAQEEIELGRMRDVHAKTFKTQQSVNRRWIAIEAINFFLLTRILLTGIGIWMYATDRLSLGTVYFFQASFFRVLTPFEMLGSMLPQWNKQVGRVRLAEELLATNVDVQNKPNALRPTAIKGEIVFENVRFAYSPEKRLSEDDESAKHLAPHEEHAPSAEEEAPADAKRIASKRDESNPESVENASSREILTDVNLRIRPGEKIALVGHSGAGKSTMAMLLNRFYDVKEGRITIDGVDVRDLDVRVWRSRIGLVLQDNLMFNDSILENIRYARPDATNEEVFDAARRAAADDFIEELPNGYATLIGDRGIRLSGGQRQRVAIARAILKKPSIVILDEATSALDSVTEKRVQEGIRELVEGRTSVIIAHRLSTVRSVDRIAVMEEGRVTAFAPHAELMKISPVYKEMVELQRQGMLAE